MIQFKTARRKLLLALSAPLLSVPLVVAGATAANAEPCWGRVSITTTSRPNLAVTYYLRYNNLYGNIYPYGQSIRGEVNNPIVAFSTTPARSARFAYYNLPYPGQHLRTDTVPQGGYFNLNPCHEVIVTIL
ncbi:hypothetical protein [Nonomuraea sp. LPB2021202275-12-8]|uniref:hypothetical protein n=1 Tax=Nonomuraea sp. LPB2021202275-12-8 TaxID=3120159 RepID=UPI00300C110E